MSDISCKFSADIGAVPLSEYPRPQFERADWICLNGEYSYSISKSEQKPLSLGGKILVPFAPESKLSGVERHLEADEIMWYGKSFEIPKTWKEKRVILNFGAVDHICAVYINGSEVGSHRGGYNPFFFDITDCLQDGVNELVVKVTDPTDKGGQQRGKQATASHGFWYTATSGIWQTVWLECVNKLHINSVKTTPNIGSESVIFTPDIPDGCVLGVEIFDADNKKIAEKDITETESIAVPDMQLWSPENPYLYSVLYNLKKDGEVTDTVKSYFGMREFSIKKDNNGYQRLCLNGKPYFQSGLLDQGYWCDSGLTPPTDEAMIYDIQKMKDMGFNMLRKHIKVEPARWYYHCDRLGMLVWQDMVSGGDYVSTLIVGALPNINIKNLRDDNYKMFKRENPDEREHFKVELFEMIDNLYNSVSICCWVPFNEGWGQFDAYEIGWAVKKKDPTRFVDHASGWHDRKGPDFVSMHKYILPVTLPKKDPNRPFVLSEFGGYSYTIPGHVWNLKKSFGYVMFKSSASLTAAIKKLYEKQIIPLIPKGLSACVYTQVSDVEFEVNGMLSYDRKIIKADEQVIKEINKKMHY